MAEEGGGALLARGMLTGSFYSSLSSETTTKITPWSPDYTSGFKQPFISGKNHPLPQTDQSAQDGIPPVNMDSCCGDQSQLRWKRDPSNKKGNSIVRRFLSPEWLPVPLWNGNQYCIEILILCL